MKRFLRKLRFFFMKNGLCSARLNHTKCPECGQFMDEIIAYIPKGDGYYFKTKAFVCTRCGGKTKR